MQSVPAHDFMLKCAAKYELKERCLQIYLLAAFRIYPHAPDVTYLPAEAALM